MLWWLWEIYTLFIKCTKLVLAGYRVDYDIQNVLDVVAFLRIEVFQDHNRFPEEMLNYVTRSMGMMAILGGTLPQRWSYTWSGTNKLITMPSCHCTYVCPDTHLHLNFVLMVISLYIYTGDYGYMKRINCKLICVIHIGLHNALYHLLYLWAFM